LTTADRRLKRGDIRQLQRMRRSITVLVTPRGVCVVPFLFFLARRLSAAPIILDRDLTLVDHTIVCEGPFTF